MTTHINQQKIMSELNDHANNKKNKSNFSYFWSADVIGM